jgi:hypothetical protein
LVTGEPVSRRRKANPAAIFISALVRLALWFLIVVDSSIPIRPYAPNLVASHLPACCPLSEEKASTFMTKIVRPSNRSATDLSSSCCFLLGLATQRITRWGTSSDMCSGISLVTQLRYTPLGAMIRAKFTSPARYSCPILSNSTFDFPVPISMKKPNSGRRLLQ